MSTATTTAPALQVDAYDRLLDLVADRRLMVLTGAGVSTNSGIPDYRDADGCWKRQRPMEFRTFVGDPRGRARYWARSQVGWRTFGAAKPNAAHHALARLQRAGRVGLLVTQNVDGLHQAAGSTRVLDLHGRLDRVVCLGCRSTGSRAGWQRVLDDANPRWGSVDAPVAPDGDADLEPVLEEYIVPTCPRCGGVVKPDVVFFGESVPSWRHAQAMAALGTAGGLLVVGSSLMVFSGFRYARAAARLARPLAAVNHGRTRADDLLDVKVEADCGAVLTRLADDLGRAETSLPHGPADESGALAPSRRG